MASSANSRMFRIGFVEVNEKLFIYNCQERDVSTKEKNNDESSSLSKIENNIVKEFISTEIFDPYFENLSSVENYTKGAISGKN